MGAVETAALPGALCYSGSPSRIAAITLGSKRRRCRTALCYSRARACAMPRHHLRGIGIDLMLAGFVPDDQPDGGLGGTAERHRRPRLGSHRASATRSGRREHLRRRQGLGHRRRIDLVEDRLQGADARRQRVVVSIDRALQPARRARGDSGNRLLSMMRLSSASSATAGTGCYR